MKFLLKLLAIVVLGPVALVLLLLIAAAGIVGLPLLWEALVAKLTAPPKREGEGG